MNESSISSKPLILTYEALRIANEQEEQCKHLDISTITVNIKKLSIEDVQKVKFKIRCIKCEKCFCKTEKIMRQRFIEGTK